MCSDEYFMKLALEEAKKASMKGEIPIGAIVVLDNKVISTGKNEVIERKDPTSHAEINAIREASLVLDNFRLPECELYTTLEPCLMCMGAIIEARFKRLIIGASDQRRGTVISNLHLHESPVSNHKIEIKSGVLSEDCSKLLQNFFIELRQKKKSGEVSKWS